MKRRMGAQTSRSGFTIVELLIVIVVIAILAAITIVAYNGIQNQAKSAAAQATAKQALTKIQTYAVQNADQYPATLAAAGLTNAGSTTYQYRVDNSANPKTFCLTATTDNTSYYVSHATTSPTAGACSGHAVNGGEVITNLARVNPSASSAIAWYPVVNTGVGTSLVVSSGGPTDTAPSFFRMTITTPPTSARPYIGYGSDPSHRIAPTAGQPLSLSGWVRSSRAIVVQLTAVASSAGGNEWNRIGSGPSVTIQPNSWTRLTYQAGPWPSDSGHAVTRVLFETMSPVSVWQSGDTFDATAIMATATPALPAYADGSSPGWIWNGTPNDSTSTGPPL
ncbi:hypothetical protein CMN23_03440 [Candidatus Saccharibacteria bacterium]|nr:hypothetical protein [Candidatus Saccharibacteria bacterium]MBJ58429.1 hypothetical protein [Candidatus Saccharibacteria bacterium]